MSDCPFAHEWPDPTELIKLKVFLDMRDFEAPSPGASDICHYIVSVGINVQGFFLNSCIQKLLLRGASVFKKHCIRATVHHASNQVSELSPPSVSTCVSSLYSSVFSLDR